MKTGLSYMLFKKGLATGQGLESGLPKKTIADVAGGKFKGKCPLWTYILAEAANYRADLDISVTPAMKVSTPQLGPVGGRIVAEVFLGMLFGDNDSFLSAEPDWIPSIRSKAKQFALRDIVAYALGN